MKRVFHSFLLFLFLFFLLIEFGCQSSPKKATFETFPPRQYSRDDSLEEYRLLKHLLSIPHLTVKRIDPDTLFRFAFEIQFPQPVQHGDQNSSEFLQRIRIFHRGFDRPVVLVTEGYTISSTLRTLELTRFLNANQIVVEHRYFGTSRPDSLDWEHLTVEQAANDHHRVVEFFKKIYPGKWVSTGISKGGQTSLFFKYYFPDDVDATIAYVAPMNLEREDARISRFIRQQGGEECYRRITEFQRALLSKRDVILPLLEQQRREKNLQFFLPDEEMLEYAILEFPFSFWQWHSGDCNSIPDSTVEADSLLAYLLKVVPPGMYSVQAYERLQPAFYQFYSQLGYYDFSYNAPSVFDLLTAVRHPTNEVFLKPELRKPFDKQLMPRIHRWLSQQGKHIITIYGANDPWSASALVFDATSENLSIFKPGGNHRTRISDLPEELQQQVFERLSRWLKMSVPDTSRMNKAA